MRRARRAGLASIVARQDISLDGSNSFRVHSAGAADPDPRGFLPSTPFPARRYARRVSFGDAGVRAIGDRREDVRSDELHSDRPRGHRRGGRRRHCAENRASADSAGAPVRPGGDFGGHFRLAAAAFARAQADRLRADASGAARRRRRPLLLPIRHQAADGERHPGRRLRAQADRRFGRDGRDREMVAASQRHRHGARLSGHRRRAASRRGRDRDPFPVGRRRRGGRAAGQPRRQRRAGRPQERSGAIAQRRDFARSSATTRHRRQHRQGAGRRGARDPRFRRSYRRAHAGAHR